MSFLYTPGFNAPDDVFYAAIKSINQAAAFAMLAPLLP
jgi:hypothetical protein